MDTTTATEVVGASLLVIVIIEIVIGAIIGWLAGVVVWGGGYGLIGDVILGIVGSIVGGALLPRVGLSLGGGLIGTIVTGVIGAIIVLLVIRLVKRA